MKTWALLPLLGAILVIAAACSSTEPAVSGPHISGIDIQSADEIKKAAEELFDDWLIATEAHDAAAIHSLLARNIADRCTVDQMETFFENDSDALTYPVMDVHEVFVSPGNAESAFMTMKLRDGPRPGNQGEIDRYLASIPYPIAREDGKWLMVLQFPAIGDGCPFTGGFSSEEAVPAPTGDSPQ